tara:strand:- start:815 stop:1081 length:267 start_codon:yes stop_codon:yes gene_type:complete
MREPRFFENPSCAGIGGDFWFPEKDNGLLYSKEMALAKSICHQCPHKSECAEWGINNEVHGIWGGLSQRELSLTRVKLNITIKRRYIA